MTVYKNLSCNNFPDDKPQNQRIDKKYFEVKIQLTITSRQIFIRLPKNDVDITFLRSFKYARWDYKNLQWIIPNYGKNLNT